jgi:hypothetical protein
VGQGQVTAGGPGAVALPPPVTGCLTGRPVTDALAVTGTLASVAGTGEPVAATGRPAPGATTGTPGCTAGAEGRRGSEPGGPPGSSAPSPPAITK